MLHSNRPRPSCRTSAALPLLDPALPLGCASGALVLIPPSPLALDPTHEQDRQFPRTLVRSLGLRVGAGAAGLTAQAQEIGLAKISLLCNGGVHWVSTSRTRCVKSVLGFSGTEGLRHPS